MLWWCFRSFSLRTFFLNQRWVAPSAIIASGSVSTIFGDMAVSGAKGIAAFPFTCTVCHIAMASILYLPFVFSDRRAALEPFSLSDALESFEVKCLFLCSVPSQVFSSARFN